MENASKSLIIAGTILISLLLISIGLPFLNSTSGITEETNNRSKSISISTFNSHFTQYFGKSVPGSNARTLITNIKIHNASTTNPSSNDEEKIYVNLKAKNYAPAPNSNYYTGGHRYKENQLQTLINAVSPTSTYTIRATKGCSLRNQAGGYNTKTGHIYCITIIEN